MDAWRLDLVPNAIKVSPVLFGGQDVDSSDPKVGTLIRIRVSESGIVEDRRMLRVDYPKCTFSS